MENVNVTGSHLTYPWQPSWLSVSHFVCCCFGCHVCLLPLLELVRWDMSHGLRLGLPEPHGWKCEPHWCFDYQSECSPIYGLRIHWLTSGSLVLSLAGHWIIKLRTQIWELTDKWDSLLDPIPNSTVSKFKSLTFIYLIPGVVNSISIYRTGGKFTYFLSWAGPPAGPLAFRCDTMPEYYVL